MVRKSALIWAVVAAAGFGSACGGDDSDGSGGKKGSGGATGGGGTGGGKGGTGGAGGSVTGGAGGTTGGTGGTSGASGSSGSGGSAGAAYQKLSETGLYSDIANGTIASGVVEYRPRFQLWSDNATKKRWVYLPPGSKIDTTDMDYWVYPVGMKLWKEFTRGTRIETRLIEKTGDNTWYVMAFQWDSGQTDATAVPTGVPDAAGHNDIPSQSDCETCHGKMKDHVLSFSAIQLSHQLGGLNLQDLIDQGRLTKPPSAPFTLPGNDTDQNALGYLHANCGLCHNENSFVFATVNMQLWLKTGSLATVAGTPTYMTTVNKPLTASNPTGKTSRIVPKNPDASDIHFRMSQRGTLTQMPPLASEVVDDTGLQTVTDWINTL